MGIVFSTQFHVLIKSRRTSQSTSVLNNNKSKKPKKDFIYISTNREGNETSNTVHEEDTSICFIPKPINETKLLEPALRKRKLKALEQRNDFVRPEAIAQYRISNDHEPFRQYYHSKSLAPITKSEWDEGLDSDDEIDDDWIRQLGERVSILVFNLVHIFIYT